MFTGSLRRHQGYYAGDFGQSPTSAHSAPRNPATLSVARAGMIGWAVAVIDISVRRSSVSAQHTAARLTAADSGDRPRRRVEGTVVPATARGGGRVWHGR